MLQYFAVVLLFLALVFVYNESFGDKKYIDHYLQLYFGGDPNRYN